MFKIKAINNLISGLLILAVLAPSALFFTQPKKAEAQFSDPLNGVWQQVQAVFNAGSWVVDKTIGKIEFQKLAKDILKDLGQIAARKALRQMTQSTLNYINKGYWENPLFLENPDSFFKDIAKSEIKDFVDMIGYNRFMPFGKDMALKAIDAYKRQLNANLEHSMSRVFQDPGFLQKFQTDLSVGGWNGFVINTQYQQNTPIGFQMRATEVLARRLAGTTQNAAQKIQKTLEQGQGFLAPQTCGTRPEYNSVANQFKQPKWPESEYNRKNPAPEYEEGSWETEEQFNEALNEWEATKNDEKAKWDNKNTCPDRDDGSSGFVTTTPGSVIASATMEALNAPQENVYAAMVTGSLATIFDALLAKWMGKGLSSLGKKINPQKEDKDDWDYYGNTLGTVTPYGSEDWGGGPDIEIVLSEFEQMVADGIANTTEELALLDNPTVNAAGQFTNPGLTQMLGFIWPKIKNLDMCLPGPDIGWEARLQKEYERNSQVFMGKLGETEGQTAAESQKTLNELEFAVKFFEDWIKNKMLVELPNSVIYMEAVAEIEDLHQLAQELITRKRTKTQTLARLQAIRGILNTINNQPAPDTADEKKLIEAWKQYTATRSTIANSATINTAQNELSILKEQSSNVDDLLTQCEKEREVGGWSIPDYITGGATSINSAPVGNECKLQKNLIRTGNGAFGVGGANTSADGSCTERQMFCSYPIHGGYAHDPFNTNKSFADYNGPDVTHPEIPLVNASRVIYGNDCGFAGARCWFGGTGELTADIKISCDAIYNATPLDYKGSIPGANTQTYIRPPNEEESGRGGGQCADTGNKHQAALRSAIDAVIAANPSVANLPNIEDGSSGRGLKANGKIFLTLVAEYINTSGGSLRATAEVLNGNNNTSTGDIIAVWRAEDSVMERYDAMAGATQRPDGSWPTVGEGAQTNFEGFIPLNCTSSGGGNDCGCQTEEVVPPPPPQTPGTNPNPGTLFISSVSPAVAKPGTTTLTINGDALTTTVQFFDGGGKSYTVVGNINSAKTQVTVLTPSDLPIGNATVKINNSGTVSNGKLIAISATGGSGGGGSGGGVAAPSTEATGGWGGNLAQDSTSGNWLVVSGGVNGRIMSSSGQAVSSPFKIEQTPQSVQVMSPKVAFASDINKYLVVWIGFPNAAGGTIYGRFVNTDGSLSGNAFTIFTDPAGGTSFIHPNTEVIYDNKNKKFVFVWEYRRPLVDVNMVTISQTGVVSAPTKIGVDANGESWHPSLAVNETTNEYCIAYDKRNNGNNVSAVRSYNAATGTLGTESVLTGGGMYTSIVHNSVNNKYLIGWNTANSLTSQARILNTCNVTNGGNIFTSNSAGQTQTLAYNPVSNTYASIVQNQNNYGNNYNIFSSTATKIKEGVAFTSTTTGNFAPTIAANMMDGTFTATSSLGYTMTRFAPNLGIPTQGSVIQPVSAPKYLDLGPGSFPDVVWFQARLYVAYRSANNLAINLYSYDKNLGDQRVEKIFILSSGAGGYPRMTTYNNTLWLAYRDGESSGEDIKLWRKDTGATESLGPAVGNDPVAVGNGYIAWQKCEGTNCANSKVYRRQLAGGTQVYIQNSLPTGIARILPNGSVVMIDTDRTAVTWGLNAWFAGKLTVATDVTPNDDNGVAARMNNLASSEFNLWLGQRTHTPHAATDLSGNYAVATWNPTVRIATFTGPI